MRTVALLVFCELLLDSVAQTATVPINRYIVTCRQGTYAGSIAKECRGKPMHEYIMPSAGSRWRSHLKKSASLSMDKRILAVEPDGEIQLCGQTNSTGVVRMEIDRFPIGILKWAGRFPTIFYTYKSFEVVENVIRR